MTSDLQILQAQLDGELFYDDLMKAMYATDASVYRMLPLAVAYPKSERDIQRLIAFANSNKTSLIPRTAGTSLAGQCVGPGIVVDVSKYFTKIVSINEKQRTVTVQPGVVRDQLNNFLKPFGLFFAPNTSTSNRCMIGGMVGNNSSGSTSIKYGVTRDKVLAIKTILSDGSTVMFNSMSKGEFSNKKEQNDLEGYIYRTIYDELESKEVQQRIIAAYPKPEIHRRNTGYAIDEVLKCEVFTETEEKFNMSRLLAGSEGTLAFSTEITLQLDALPPVESIMVALHFNSIADCMKAVVPVMNHDLYSCEMMDKTILDLTKHNKTQQENRQFIEGDPKAILMCEVRANSKKEVEEMASHFLKAIELETKSYANALLYGDEMDKAIDLRKAGLGLLGNMVGDKKSAACIEDTAVALGDLDAYISEFTQLMEGYDQKAIYYAHAGAGELHLRPILNLKLSNDVLLFRKITTDVAHLVKKYNGAMSGEHGEGIVRGEFIPLMIGDENYQLLKCIKTAFDPNGILNPGKIVDAFPMDQSLRYVADRKEPEIETFLDFSESQGILREAEKCNGSGDCRKLPEFGGTMCPSYRATKNEKDTTRARANALREFLTNSAKPNRFNHEELKEVFDLCLSCKACASECPSSVDMARLKAEFLYQFQKANGISWRTKLFAYNNAMNKLGSTFPSLANFMFSNEIIASSLKKIMQVAPERVLPLISSKSLSKEFELIKNQLVKSEYVKSIYLFNDEFVNYLDTSIGVDFLELMECLNYEVIILENVESGRSFLSKGLLEQAKKVANQNVDLFKGKISVESPLVGIEPSAILTFRDEYLTLVDDKEAAKSIASNTFLFEEFIQSEINLGNIKEEQFTREPRTIKFHGHCHQKALSNQKASFDVLNFPKNYKVTIIPSGCCGMAGSFGYEKEHYKVSMDIGEQTLFPAVRNAEKDVIIAANGTSCRHQIKDGTAVEALHPITILKQALARN
ncbi:FAD-binding and (Fe-S)-binding domain-containing protein [Mangrovimonas sp. YM274]|uniref:FAD-binding and (Fe-S)-binding domain-containing protein n=1 Tax=Mangrovimonas sp. YM274 TaxID=3070660 RepID=UPI0027DDF25F|nr:FAD-binding and (Fe-S)-binding domain-containing protein [Mangrovimonas sp. YM274]WMI67379.1 FAD-linked oxidase C-terminal domain-containing protein [Mangrovimonas sp. YM274]